MASTLKLGKGNWGVKEDSLLAYSDQNNNFIPLPFDFSRASSATVVNKAGLVESVTSGLPRIDFSDDTNGALLLEPQSTNLVTYSESYNFWAKTSANVTSNAATSPEGVQNASKIVEASGLSFHFILSYTSVVSGSTTFSFYAKAAERTSVSAFLSQGGNNGANFDLSAETATAQGTGNTASIESVGNGWYRCIVSNNGSAQVANQVRIGIQNGALNSYVGDGTSGIYIWGAQLENLPYTTSYIPTTGATATRVRDICTGAGNASTFNSTEGVLYAEIAALADDGTLRVLSISDGTSNNRIQLRYDSSSNSITLIYRVSGGSFVVLTKVVSNTEDFIKLSFRWKSGDFALWINGVEEQTSSNTTMLPIDTLNRLDFNDSTGASDFYGNAKQVIVFPTALSDAELEALTTI